MQFEATRRRLVRTPCYKTILGLALGFTLGLFASNMFIYLRIQYILATLPVSAPTPIPALKPQAVTVPTTSLPKKQPNGPVIQNLDKKESKQSGPRIQPRSPYVKEWSRVSVSACLTMLEKEYVLRKNKFAISHMRRMGKHMCNSAAKLPAVEPKRIALFMGALNIFHMDGSGSTARGDLMQWIEMVGSFQALGHEVLHAWEDQASGALRKPNDIYEYDLLLFDYVALAMANSKKDPRGKMWQDMDWARVRCKIRILDVFGTDPEYFTNPKFRKGHPPGNINPALWSMNPRQVWTFEPLNQSNTFGGYMLAPPPPPIPKKWSALLWGKEARYFMKHAAALREMCKHVHVIATVARIPGAPCVDAVGVLSETAYMEKIAPVALFIGLADPVGGHGAAEAVGKGMIYINAMFDPPRKLPGKPTKLHWKFQQMMLGYAGEPQGDPSVLGPFPRVLNVKLNDLADVARTMKRAREIFDSHKNELARGIVHPLVTSNEFAKRMAHLSNEIFLGESCYASTPY